MPAHLGFQPGLTVPHERQPDRGQRALSGQLLAFPDDGRELQPEGLQALTQSELELLQKQPNDDPKGHVEWVPRGVDLAQPYIEHAKRHNEDARIVFEVADACALPYPAQSFDRRILVRRRSAPCRWSTLQPAP